jgi:malonate decarboxylase alpha subunit
MGSDAAAATSAAWLDMITNKTTTRSQARGQVVETFHGWATVDRRYAGRHRGRQKAGVPIAPVMIYGDDVTHVVTEEK